MMMVVGQATCKDTDMVATVVFDLDGTLACGKHRLHLLPHKDSAQVTQSWNEFNLAAGADEPIQDNIDLCNNLCNNMCEPHNIVILTGRCAIARQITVQWLALNGVCYDTLIMRPEDDHRPDTEFKEEELRKIGLENILCAFDDLEHVAKHMRSLGVTCHLVTHYDEKRVDVAPRSGK